jgi:hypothetical protein
MPNMVESPSKVTDMGGVDGDDAGVGDEAGASVGTAATGLDEPPPPPPQAHNASATAEAATIVFTVETPVQNPT